MALSKRPLTKDTPLAESNSNSNNHSGGNTNTSSDLEATAIKRRKRCSGDEDAALNNNNNNNNNNNSNSNNNNILPQKKRKQGPIPDSPESPPTSIPTVGTAGVAKMTAADADQDDETLIRETQAALKSLSGSWPDARANLYRLQEQDENPPPFQNLFEEKQKYEAIAPRTPTTTATVSLFPRFHRQKENDQARLNAGATLEDRERAAESAAGLAYYGYAAAAAASQQQQQQQQQLSLEPTPLPPRAAFDIASQLGEKPSKNSKEPLAGALPGTGSGSGTGTGHGGSQVDAKQYTILQPAGVGSRAASVMQDIAREGVVGVPLVATPPSTSSPPTGGTAASTATSTSTPAPSYSPGSQNRGKFFIVSIVNETLQLTVIWCESNPGYCAPASQYCDSLWFGLVSGYGSTDRSADDSQPVPTLPKK
ncbi:GL14768 [Drosophila persimilis]|uniref:GL14768 n=1 Tax=Drosophila persimilis TaxID=7234 RepID=B4GW39_DROPE|nr:GL14768 [Drosophila persimilis]